MIEYSLNRIAEELARISTFAPIDWAALRKMTEELGPAAMTERTVEQYVAECAKRVRAGEGIKFVALYYARNWIRERNAFYIPSLEAVYADYTWRPGCGGAAVLPEWNRIDQTNYEGQYPVPLAEPNVIYCERAYLCPRCLNFWSENLIANLNDKQAKADEKAVYSFFERGMRTSAWPCSADEINGIVSKCYQKPFEYRKHTHECRDWYDCYRGDFSQRQARQLSAEWQAEHPDQEFPPSVYYSIPHRMFNACLRHHGKWVRESFRRIEDAILFVEAKLAEPPDSKNVPLPTRAEYQFFSMAKAASEIVKGRDDTITDATTNSSTNASPEPH